MKNAVVIKSFPNGMFLYLNPDMDFEALLEEVCIKFKESSHFFGESKIALSIKERQLSEEEEMRVLDAISQNSDIHILCLVKDNAETDFKFIKAIEQANPASEDIDSGSGQFYRGSLKNGQKLETESSIVVIGDVYPGSAIISKKDIIVLGGLYGEAYAGSHGEANHFVAALEMSPEKIKIGDFKYKAKEKSKWSIKLKMQPKIAYVKDNAIITDYLTKDLLNDFPL